MNDFTDVSWAGSFCVNQEIMSGVGHCVFLCTTQEFMSGVKGEVTSQGCHKADRVDQTANLNAKGGCRRRDVRESLGSTGICEWTHRRCFV